MPSTTSSCGTRQKDSRSNRRGRARRRGVNGCSDIATATASGMTGPSSVSRTMTSSWDGTGGADVDPARGDGRWKAPARTLVTGPSRRTTAPRGARRRCDAGQRQHSGPQLVIRDNLPDTGSEPNRATRRSRGKARTSGFGKPADGVVGDDDMIVGGSPSVVYDAGHQPGRPRLSQHRERRRRAVLGEGRAPPCQSRNHGTARWAASFRARSRAA